MICLQVNNCLCCIKLKAAGIILGLLEIIAVICIFVMAILENHNYGGISSRVPFEMTCFFCVFQLLLSTLWLIGIFANKTNLMVVELYFSCLTVLLVGIMAVFVWLAAFSEKNNGAHYEALIFSLVTGILIYLWIVRMSLYRSMLQKTENKRRDKESELNENLAI